MLRKRLPMRDNREVIIASLLDLYCCIMKLPSVIYISLFFILACFLFCFFVVDLLPFFSLSIL